VCGRLPALHEIVRVVDRTGAVFGLAAGVDPVKVLAGKLRQGGRTCLDACMRMVPVILTKPEATADLVCLLL
jgi:hypothetical protein